MCSARCGSPGNFSRRYPETRPHRSRWHALSCSARAQRMPRDKPTVQAPTNAASGTQQRRRSKQETPRCRIGTHGKTPSPSRPEEKAGLQRGVARARSFRRAWSSRCAPLTHIAGLTFRRIGAEVVRVAAALASPAAADRAQLALRPQVRLSRQSPATDAPHARSSRSLTLNPQTQASPNAQQPARLFLHRPHCRMRPFPAVGRPRLARKRSD